MKLINKLLVLVTVMLLIGSCHTYKVMDQSGEAVRQITDKQVVFKDGRSIALPFADDKQATHLVLVRHAEKAFGEDAPLLATGKRRAILLSEILSNFSLDTIYATKYRRTQATAQPVARQQSRAVAIYDHENPRAFIQRIKNRHKGLRILVAGHSNTTPELINKLLGKEEVEKIDELDYDNLFILSINESGEKELLKLSYRFDKEISD